MRACIRLLCFIIAIATASQAFASIYIAAEEKKWEQPPELQLQQTSSDVNASVFKAAFLHAIASELVLYYKEIPAQKVGFSDDFFAGSNALFSPVTIWDVYRWRMEAESVLTQSSARFFDPQLQIYLSPDPLLYSESSSLYQSFLNNPLQRRDPDGTESIRELFNVEKDIDEKRYVKAYFKIFGYSLWNTFTFGFVSGHDEVFEKYKGGEYVAMTIAETGKATAIGGITLATGGIVGNATRTLPTLASGSITGGAVSTSSLVTEDIINLSTGGSAHTLRQHAINTGTGVMFGGAFGYSAQRYPNLNRYIFTRQPGQLPAGRAFEMSDSAQAGIIKDNRTIRPEQLEVESAAFRVIVGRAKLTSTGRFKGTIPDGTTSADFIETKSGFSPLYSSYQMRLQTYKALKVGRQPILRTTRPINQTFHNWLTRWAWRIEPIRPIYPTLTFPRPRHEE